ncbi:hypothetical protein ES705_38646 [subsurface metagenome]
MTEPETIEYKGEKVFTVCSCKGKIVATPDGKKHLEYECPDKATRDELAAILEEESILRVKPKVIVEEPVTEPE